MSSLRRVMSPIEINNVQVIYGTHGDGPVLIEAKELTGRKITFNTTTRPSRIAENGGASVYHVSYD